MKGMKAIKFKQTRKTVGACDHDTFMGWIRKSIGSLESYKYIDPYRDLWERVRDIIWQKVSYYFLWGI